MAIYYFRNAGTNWGDATNWSLSDGGGADGAVPTATDDAYFTSNSGNCTVNATQRFCRALIFSGVGAGNYSNTFTINQQLTVADNVTLSATMTVTDVNTLRINTATVTLTSNGTIWSGSIAIIAGNPTITLVGNWTIIGSLSTTVNTGTTTINGNTLTVGGSFTSTITSGVIVGTTNIVLNGTGTLATDSATGGSIQNNLTINTSGTITLGTRLAYSLGTFTYTAGTVVTAGNTLRILGNCTLATNGITWNTITFGQFVTTQNQTITLTNALNCANVTTNNTTGSVTLTASTLTVSGNFTANTITTGNIGGTTNIVLNGNGTLSTNAATTGAVISNLTINASGTITFGTVFSYGTRTFTYTSGTVVTSGNTLRLQASCTLNLNGINFNAIVTNGTATYTLTSNLTASTLSLGSSIPTINGNTCFLTSYSGLNNAQTGTTVMYFNGWDGDGTFTSNNWGFQDLIIDTSGRLDISTLNISVGVTRNVTQIRGAVTIDFMNTSAATNNLTFLSNTIINTLQITRPNNTTNLINDLYVRTLRFAGGNSNMSGVALNGAGKKVYVLGSVVITNATDISGLTGTATIELIGNGTLLSTVNLVSGLQPTGNFNIPVTINTDGLITIPTTYTPNLAGVFRFVRGNIVRNNATVVFRSNIFGANKSNFDNVQILGGASITMDEFFSGAPDRPVTVSSTSTTNYTITFQDNFEKFARFTKVSRATITRRGQLTVLTQEANNGSNLGVNFAQNQLANGLSKNNPSVNRFTAYGIAGLPKDVTLS